jgi:hypothetical protein
MVENICILLALSLAQAPTSMIVFPINYNRHEAISNRPEA